MSHVVRHALRHLSRESFAVVLQRMSVPAEVRPNAPSSEQNAPGCTLPWTGCGAVDCVALGVLGALVLAGGGGGAAITGVAGQTRRHLGELRWSE